MEGNATGLLNRLLGARQLFFWRCPQQLLQLFRSHHPVFDDPLFSSLVIRDCFHEPWVPRLKTRGKKGEALKLVRNGLAKANYVFTNEFLAWFVSGSFSISSPHNLLEERAPAAAPMTPNDKPKPSCGFHPKALMFLTKPIPRRAPKAPTLVFTLKREYAQTEPRMKGGLLEVHHALKKTANKRSLRAHEQKERALTEC